MSDHDDLVKYGVGSFEDWLAKREIIKRYYPHHNRIFAMGPLRETTIEDICGYLVQQEGENTMQTKITVTTGRCSRPVELRDIPPGSMFWMLPDNRDLHIRTHGAIPKLDCGHGHVTVMQLEGCSVGYIRHIDENKLVYPVREATIDAKE